MKWLFALLLLAGCDRVFGLFEIVDASSDMTPEGGACARFQARHDYDVGSNPAGIALADVNNDNHVDILVPNAGSGEVSILINDGAGAFTVGTPLAMGATAQPTSVIAFNLNNDSFPDLVVVNPGLGNVAVLPGRGDGTFGAETDYTFGTVNPVAVAAAPIDSNTTVDLVVVLENGGIQVLINVGSSFSTGATGATGSVPTDVALADVNGDAKNDLLVASLGANVVSVFPGTGMGAFNIATQISVRQPRAITVGFLDGGSTIDLTVANDAGNTVTVLRGVGDGTFSNRTTIDIGAPTYDVAFGSLGSDMMMDVAVAAQTSSVFVSDGDGGGGFTTAASYDIASPSRGLAVGDLDGRAPQDVVVANYDASSISVLLGCP